MEEYIDRITILDNGVSIVTREIPWSRRIAFQIVVKAGSAIEKPEEYGYAHFTEHVLPSQTYLFSSYAQLNNAFRALGFGGFNISTNIHYIKCPSGGNTGSPYYFSPSAFSAALDIVMDVIARPQFPEKGVEDERRGILEEIAAAKKDISQNNGRLWMSSLFPNTYYGRNVLGDEDSVSNASRDGLKSYWERNFVGERTFLCAAGRLDHEQIIRQAKPVLGRLPQGTGIVYKPMKPQLAELRIPYGVSSTNGTVSLLMKRAAPLVFRYFPSLADSFPSLSEQVYMELVWPGSCTHSKLSIPRSLAMAVLDSMLYDKLIANDRLLYGINSSGRSELDYGLLSVYGRFHWKKQNLVFDCVHDCLRELANNPSEEIIENLKKGKKCEWDTYEPTTLHQSERIRDEYIAYGRLLTNEEKLNEALQPTPDDVKGVAQEILLNTPASLYLNGPVERLPSRRKIDARIRGTRPVRTPS